MFPIFCCERLDLTRIDGSSSFTRFLVNRLSEWKKFVKLIPLINGARVTKGRIYLTTTTTTTTTGGHTFDGATGPGPWLSSLTSLGAGRYESGHNPWSVERKACQHRNGGWRWWRQKTSHKVINWKGNTWIIVVPPCCEFHWKTCFGAARVDDTMLGDWCFWPLIDQGFPFG